MRDLLTTGLEVAGAAAVLAGAVMLAGIAGALIAGGMLAVAASWVVSR